MAGDDALGRQRLRHARGDRVRASARDQPGRDAGPERAARAQPRPPPRAAGQVRDRADDRAFGADGVGDHAPPRGRSPAPARRAAARAGRPADGADVARPRGRLLHRREDRAAQPRDRARRLPRQRRGITPRPPTPSRRSTRPSPGSSAWSPPARRCSATAPSRIAGVGLAMPFELWSWAEEIGAAEAELAAWRDARHPRASSPRSCPIRSISRTTPPPPAGRSSPSATTPASSTSSISTSAPSSAAGSFSTAASTPGAPATPRRSARCRCPARPARPSSSSTAPRSSLLERRLLAAGQPVETLYDPGAPTGRASIPISATGSPGPPRASPTPSPRRAPSSTSRRRSSTAPSRSGSARASSPASPRNCAVSTSRGSSPPTLRAGSIGPIARALGGASLPLFDRYLLDQHTLAGPGPARAPEERPPVTPSRTRGRRPEGAPPLAAKPAPQRRVRKAMFSSRWLPPATAAM